MSRAALLIALAASLGACSKSSPKASDGDSPKKPEMNDPSPTDPPASDKRAIIHLTGTDGEQIVSAEVVSTPKTIQRGLMYRTKLPPDEGMLFLLGYEDDHAFWMHNTLISLDLIYIGKDMKVVGVAANAPIKSDKRILVGAQSLYVLEVNAGWAAAHGVGTGATVRFDGVEAAAH
jgi:uncharacterized membrane protein (UPF0127 family)